VIVPAFGRLGLIPEVGTSWALTRRLGYQGAFAYYLRGEHIDAHTAQRLGLVQQVVEHDRLLATADEWCSRVAAMPAHAVAMTKPLLRAAADAGWNDALTLEEFAEPTCFTTAAFADSVHICWPVVDSIRPSRTHVFGDAPTGFTDRHACGPGATGYGYGCEHRRRDRFLRTAEHRRRRRTQQGHDQATQGRRRACGPCCLRTLAYLRKRSMPRSQS
jgi:hypothetical protein